MGGASSYDIDAGIFDPDAPGFQSRKKSFEDH